MGVKLYFKLWQLSENSQAVLHVDLALRILVFEHFDIDRVRLLEKRLLVFRF